MFGQESTSAQGTSGTSGTAIESAVLGAGAPVENSVRPAYTSANSEKRAKAIAEDTARNAGGEP
jgi:hypothetical protein